MWTPSTELGIGIAIGMLAGTTGLQGSARGRMTLLAAVIALVAGFLLEGPLGALLAAIGAVAACLVVSDVVSGAGRREGSAGALGFLIGVAALIVIAVSLLASFRRSPGPRRAWSGSGSPAAGGRRGSTTACACCASRGSRSTIIRRAMPAKKLVLTYVDSLRTDMLERAVAEERAPTFGALLERGVLVPDCVSSFPSVTPVACAEMVTGVGADRHWISGMNWYHRLERRYVEYGSSLEATRAFGVFRALYDLVYNMNLAHLSPEVETVFESLDDAGARTACTPFLIYRGRHRHQVSLEGLLRRAVDATRLKFRHHTWGPKELFYGDLYASRPVPCKSTSIPGTRDDYSACCAAELVEADLFDFLLFSLPDNDNYSHRHGPEATVESIARADQCFAKLVEAAGGLDGFLDRYALILLADHAQTDGPARPAAGRAARPRVVGAAALRRPARAGAARGQPDRSRRPRLPAPRRGRARRARRGAPPARRPPKAST